MIISQPSLPVEHNRDGRANLSLIHRHEDDEPLAVGGDVVIHIWRNHMWKGKT